MGEADVEVRGGGAASPRRRRRGAAGRAHGAAHRGGALHPAAHPELRDPRRGGARADRGQRRPGAGGDRRRASPTIPSALARWRDAGADVRGDRVHLPQGLARQALRARRRGPSSSTRATPSAASRSAARNLVLAPVYGPPFVRDMERRPALRDDRGFPQLREARLHVEMAAPLGRHGLRADRRRGEQAPSRHAARAHDADRQAVHGLGDRAGAGRGFGRDVPDPVRRGPRRAGLLHDLASSTSTRRWPSTRR